MSHFMSSMPAAGLIEMPPVSKVTPLPTNATGWSFAPPPFHCMTSSLDSRALPWPTPSREPMPRSRIAASPRISTSTPRSRRPLALGRQGFRVHDVGRLRDQVAGQEDAVRQPVQRLERLARRRGVRRADRHPGERRLPVGLLPGAVPVEAVAAQPGAEGGPRRRFRAADPAAVDRIEQQGRRISRRRRSGRPRPGRRRSAPSRRRIPPACRGEQHHPVEPAAAGAGRISESPPPPLKRLAATARVTAPSSASSTAAADALNAVSFRAKTTSVPSLGRARSVKRIFIPVNLSERYRERERPLT